MDWPWGIKDCCFRDFNITINGKTQVVKDCYPLTQKQYDNLDQVIEQAKTNVISAGGTVDKYVLDCNSNYIIISMLTLLLLFL